jgi:hydrogenase expression/formation protein HypD
MFAELGILDEELAGVQSGRTSGTGVKYLDEFRDPVAARILVDRIRRRATRTWTIMEVCGGQTHSIIRNGIDQLLGDAVEFIHGPGCPVCVTPWR